MAHDATHACVWHYTLQVDHKLLQAAAAQRDGKAARAAARRQANYEAARTQAAAQTQEMQRKQVCTSDSGEG
eukprot:351599-Chlamydomonas_euryale.AAC.3